MPVHLPNNPQHSFFQHRPLAFTVSLEPLTQESFLLCDTTLINLIARDLLCECSPDSLFLPVPEDLRIPNEVLANLDIDLPVLLCAAQAQIEALCGQTILLIFYQTKPINAGHSRTGVLSLQEKSHDGTCPTVLRSSLS